MLSYLDFRFPKCWSPNDHILVINLITLCAQIGSLNLCTRYLFSLELFIQFRD